MGVFLGQLPPAELARLKAELAETLIAHFCYPRFYDYRTESLRTRPVDRSKRQEVWLYLSSVDFTTWNAVDLMSAEFQHKIELLYIQFVQRNRSYFGEQGRKRMADIRMQIGSSATSVAQGLRNHLTGQHRSNPPFGSPRSVMSWAARNVQGRKEISWEQAATSTFLLQQQLLESRNEGQPEALPVATIARRPQMTATSGIDGRSADHNGVAATPLPTGPVNVATPQVSRTATADPHSATPPATPRKVVAVPSMIAGEAPAKKMETAESPTMPMATPVPQAKVWPLAQAPIAPSPVPQAKVSPPTQAPVAPSPVPQAKTPDQPSAAPSQAAPPTAISLPEESQQRDLSSMPRVASVAASNQQADMTAHSVDEDVAIFEQLRYQIILWLRIQALRSSIEVANQNPLQLLDCLRQKDSNSEIGLQVASTLLTLANQVIESGHAHPLDYKQALLFHLMHTRQ